MALSNAERQRRYREKLKEAARVPKTGGAAVSLPTAFARWLASAAAAEGEDDSVEDAVAGVMHEIIHAVTMSKSIDLLLDVPPDDPEMQPILAVFGGLEYIRAVEEWHKASFAWERSRKRDKGAAPEPPPLPEAVT